MSQLWGDCHVHSNYSDGLMTVPEQAAFFEAYGCDFRIQTDHLIVAVPEGKPAGNWLHASAWERYVEDCRHGTTARHLCLPGAELGWEVEENRRATEGWFDTKLYPRPGQPVPAESFFASLTYREALLALRAKGYRVVIAHVDQGAPLAKLTGAEVDGLEVRWDIEETRPLFERPSLAEWDRMLTAGHRVSLSSGSDAHQPDEWAGSALRTVVLGAEREPGAILDAVTAGRSYLSGTWHPDCYASLGCPAHQNTVTGGETYFTPWWEFKTIPGHMSSMARETVMKGFRAALDRGRCQAEHYPVLMDFSVGGALSGQETAGGQHVEVHLAWRTHVPVRAVRLIADGQEVFVLPTSHPAFGVVEAKVQTTLDLVGRRYVRLEIESADTADPERREVLLANPVYVIP